MRLKEAPLNKVIFIRPENKISSVVMFTIGLNQYTFNCNFEYKEAVVFLDQKLAVVIHRKNSDECDFLSKIYDFQGNLKFELPFPDLGPKSKGVFCRYSWSSEIQNGLKIVFVTNNFNYRDFWCDFDFDKEDYISSGEAR
jgi:hypothetical protein